MEYLIVKWLHVLSATVLFGTGVGSAFYMFVASRNGDARAISLMARYVVIADWAFTLPSIIVQPSTGFYLLHLAGMNAAAGWLRWSILLYGVAVACWLPVVWIQIRMRDMAAEAALHGHALPPLYSRYFARWVVLGSVAFAALLAVFFLMVVKPA